MTTIGGIGSYGCTGDGGSATSAALSEPWAMAQDTLGNIYVADRSCHKIRKITPTGIISTIAGTGIAGFSGDGGPATAAMINRPTSVAVDLAGNVYIVDNVNRRIRKVDASGIITTILGDGISGFYGDGGPATLARVNSPSSVAVDNFGNIYVADYNNNRIRKINSAGIISTYAGSALSGYGAGGVIGDGGPATSAALYLPNYLALDRNGILYFSDGLNWRIRKVDASGIITTVAGNGTEGDGGDGGPATLASIKNGGISFDLSGNMYIAQQNKVRKVSNTGIITSLPYTLSSSYAVLVNGENTIYANNTMNIEKLELSAYASSDSLSVNVDNLCSSIRFTVTTKRFLPGNSIRTYFGDNSSISTPISNTSGSGFAIVNHVYSPVGLYVVKHVLFNGAVAVDSVSYSYHSWLCKTIPVSFFFDINGNCIWDNATDPSLTLPITVAVDSNSIPVDTISCLSGFYYNALGYLNDVYSFRLLSYPAGLIPTCPTSGIITDTINGLPITHSTKYIGFGGTLSTNFDLAQHSSAKTGRHMIKGVIKSENAFCSPNYGVVTLNISPRFRYESSFPSPSSITPTSISWNITPLSPASGNSQNIEYTLVRPVDSIWLVPGDTVHSTIIIGPFIGDLDTQNNTTIRCDTVKSSFDPNKIDVLPKGNILNGTKLTYTIHFENCGNDTAHNIYVLDTLSSYLDPSTLSLVSATSVVNVVKTKTGVHNIIKFDFPNIKLPDSSHHDQCQGMVIYTIEAKTGLATGTDIFNHAGIFFDDNPVVLTDTAVNTVVIPSISALSATGGVICPGEIAHLTTNTIFVHPPHYRWKINSTTIGSDSPNLDISTLINGDTVSCLLMNSSGDTVIASSAPLIITVNPSPDAGTLSGVNTVCVGRNSTLVSSTSSSGSWYSITGNASVSGGVITGLHPGIDTINFAVTNSCGTSIAAMPIAIIDPCPLNTMPLALSDGIEVFPNPVTDLLEISVKDAAYSQFEIVNTIGQVVSKGLLNRSNTIIEVKSIPSGLYQIRVRGSDGILVKKFVKL